MRRKLCSSFCFSALGFAACTTPTTSGMSSEEVSISETSCPLSSPSEELPSDSFFVQQSRIIISYRTRSQNGWIPEGLAVCHHKTGPTRRTTHRRTGAFGHHVLALAILAGVNARSARPAGHEPCPLTVMDSWEETQTCACSLLQDQSASLPFTSSTKPVR